MVASMSEFKTLEPSQLGNVFEMIGKQWMLITAGDRNACNTMTASWGGMGVLWGAPVAFAFIRPTRYTLEFIEKTDMFTLCFFDEEYRKALNFCGTKSGRDVDKVKATGLTPAYDGEAVYFEQARTVLVCKKMYRQDLDPTCFIDKSQDQKWYNQDYHRMFVGQIQKVLQRV